MQVLPRDNGSTCWTPIDDIFLISKTSTIGYYHLTYPFPFHITKGKHYKVLRMQLVDMAIGYWFEDDKGEYHESVDWMDDRMDELRNYFSKSTD
jgi:hypothetical protein